MLLQQTTLYQTHFRQIYKQEGPVPTWERQMFWILVQFDIDSINVDRTNGLIPVSGNVSWFLNMYNAPHAFTLPKDFVMSILPVSVMA
jgi:hypothetical protein